ncbi:MAG: hypothetical protein GY720_22475 [bacterium]|nr:hypothetical protein [bacterium]
MFLFNDVITSAGAGSSIDGGGVGVSRRDLVVGERTIGMSLENTTPVSERWSNLVWTSR